MVWGGPRGYPEAVACPGVKPRNQANMALRLVKARLQAASTTFCAPGEPANCASGNTVLFFYFSFLRTANLFRKDMSTPSARQAFGPKVACLLPAISTDPTAGSSSGDVPRTHVQVEKCRKTHVPRDDFPKATAPVHL